MDKFSPKLQLAPRLNRQMDVKHETPPSYCRQDFRPPTPNGQRYQRSKEDSSYYRCTSVEEEKKTADVDKAVRPSIVMSNPTAKRAFSLWAESMKTESRSSPDQDEIERNYIDARIKKEDRIESRAGPGECLPIQENGNHDLNQAMEEDKDDQYEEAQSVDDIAMSPIPYDREDPVTLLDLPEDILALPISPCGGPHDGVDLALS